MSVRTFLALDLDAATVDRLARVREAIVDPGSKINWVWPRNLHVTLNFLGDVRDGAIAEVCEAAAEAAGRFEPFDFAVRGVIAVPPRGAPRMFWAGVDDPTGAMVGLQRELAAGLSPLGVRREERAYTPHITLARIKLAGSHRYLRATADELADREFGVQTAGEVVAYTSQLTREGPIYSAIARAPLGC